VSISRSGVGQVYGLHHVEHALTPLALAQLRMVSSTSAIWSPNLHDRVGAVIGSWKIIDMRVPRMRRSSVGDLVSTSSPSSNTPPAEARAAWRSSP